jgi:hypothetical protein
METLSRPGRRRIRICPQHASNGPRVLGGRSPHNSSRTIMIASELLAQLRICQKRSGTGCSQRRGLLPPERVATSAHSDSWR